MNNININNDLYINTLPYPYYVQNNILDNDFALNIQNEILNIDNDKWDRYDNPLEKKFTLRDKNELPINTQKLFNIMTSEQFIENLSDIVGIKLYNDPTKNWWGIHKYKNGDYLDIHSDAGIHPINNMKKHITLGIYLSKNWKEDNGGNLEIWEGDSVLKKKPELNKCITKILPSFNKLILFNNTNNAWHGNPEPVKCDDNSTRIFVTLSYLSNEYNFPYDKKFKKAFFIKRPNDKHDPEKDKIRLLRVDEEKFKDVYKILNNK